MPKRAKYHPLDCLREDLKMAINFAKLEKETFRSADAYGITPEMLGKIIAAAWQVATEGERGQAVEGDMFEFLLRADIDPPPQSVNDAIHVESRIDGERIEERTRLVVGAQSSDTIGRLNPSHVPSVHKTNLTQAALLLRQYEVKYPTEVAWIKKSIGTQGSASPK